MKTAVNQISRLRYSQVLGFSWYGQSPPSQAWSAVAEPPNRHLGQPVLGAGNQRPAAGVVGDVVTVVLDIGHDQLDVVVADGYRALGGVLALQRRPALGPLDQIETPSLGVEVPNVSIYEAVLLSRWLAGIVN